MCQKLGVYMTTREALGLFGRYDYNSDEMNGHVDYFEFIKQMFGESESIVTGIFLLRLWVGLRYRLAPCPHALPQSRRRIRRRRRFAMHVPRADSRRTVSERRCERGRL